MARWRPLCDRERLAYYFFWREVGRRMNIREIPSTYEAFEQFNVDFERTLFRFSETNRRVGEATRDLFLGWFPGPLRPMIRPAIYALMDDALIDALGFPRPSRAARELVVGVLRLRAWALRCFPARRRPHLRSELLPRSYPRGYRLEDLGPP